MLVAGEVGADGPGPRAVPGGCVDLGELQHPLGRAATRSAEPVFFGSVLF